MEGRREGGGEGIGNREMGRESCHILTLDSDKSFVGLEGAAILGIHGTAVDSAVLHLYLVDNEVLVWIHTD